MKMQCISFPLVDRTSRAAAAGLSCHVRPCLRKTCLTTGNFVSVRRQFLDLGQRKKTLALGLLLPQNANSVCVVNALTSQVLTGRSQAPRPVAFLSGGSGSASDSDDITPSALARPALRGQSADTPALACALSLLTPVWRSGVMPGMFPTVASLVKLLLGSTSSAKDFGDERTGQLSPCRASTAVAFGLIMEDGAFLNINLWRYFS